MRRSTLPPVVALCVLAVAASLGTGITAAEAQSFTEYVVPTRNSYPVVIIAGPDGNLWFTESNGNKIGRVTTTGSFARYTIPTAASGPYGIAVGPDGNLWFTEFYGNKIGKVTPTGSFTEYTIPTAGSGPFAITAGPDGNLWFTEYTYYGNAGNKIGNVTIAGSFTEYTIPTASSSPYGITVGPDGNLWFTEQVGSKIGTVTTTGSFAEYTIPSLHCSPDFITVGPDGNLWFKESNSNKIGAVTTTGSFREYTIPTANSAPVGITAGPDGNLWFTEDAANKIGRLNPPSATPTPTTTATPTSATATPPGADTPTPAATPTASLDHFTCYKVGATSGSVKFLGIPNPPGVSLQDSIDATQVALKKPKFLCAPTDVLGQDPTAPAHPEHLTGYQIKGAAPSLTASIQVTDAFNPSGTSVVLKKRSYLFVPTAKNLSATPPTPAAFVTDHFECYKIARASGTPKFTAVPGVTLDDQFGPMIVLVKKPQYLCNPVNKNGEDPSASSHPAHLTCYQVKQTDAAPFVKHTGLFVNNQFGPEELDTKKPSQLCVPATTP